MSDRALILVSQGGITERLWLKCPQIHDGIIEDMFNDLRNYMPDRPTTLEAVYGLQNRNQYSVFLIEPSLSVWRQNLDGIIYFSLPSWEVIAFIHGKRQFLKLNKEGEVLNHV